MVLLVNGVKSQPLALANIYALHRCTERRVVVQRRRRQDERRHQLQRRPRPLRRHGRASVSKFQVAGNQRKDGLPRQDRRKGEAPDHCFYVPA